MPTDPSGKSTTNTGVESTVTSDTVGSGATPPKAVGGKRYFCQLS